MGSGSFLRFRALGLGFIRFTEAKQGSNFDQNTIGALMIANTGLVFPDYNCSLMGPKTLF